MSWSKAGVGLGITLFLALAVYFNMYHGRQEAKEVTLERIGPRTLEATVSASGKLRAHREVEISANTMGLVQKLGVREGDFVKAGAFLLRIDPVPFEVAITRLRAAISLETANLDVARRAAEKARVDLEREESLAKKGLSPSTTVDTVRLQYEIKAGEVRVFELRIAQERANLAEAEHNFEKVTVNSPIDGQVSTLNIEEGENVITGTMNNVGTVLMKVSDLSTLEAEVEVDETEVVRVEPGQMAKVKIDAFPDLSFKARVTEISPGPQTVSLTAADSKAVRYKVVLAVTDPVPGARIGLSATAEITTAEREKTLAVPISSVTEREFTVDADGARIPEYEFDGAGPLHEAARDPVSNEPKKKEFQGVFAEEGGLARFYPCTIGISSDRYFEVTSGLQAGQRVVTGPYQILRELKEGEGLTEKEKVDAARAKLRRRRQSAAATAPSTAPTAPATDKAPAR